MYDSLPDLVSRASRWHLAPFTASQSLRSNQATCEEEAIENMKSFE